jgi:hypothetical protein
MSNALSPELLAQLFAQESDDPFLILVTISHASFTTIRLVNNSTQIVSRGNTYLPFPMSIKLPVDDGETAKGVSIDFDNVSLELLDELRTVTTPMDVSLEMILASIPNVVQMSLYDLKITNVTYTKTRVSASLILDTFLNTEMTGESYGPTNFPGIF